VWLQVEPVACVTSSRKRTGSGFKANYYSGPKRDGSDRLYAERLPVAVDEDVRVEYWTEIRGRAPIVPG
jgi:hypothetical protein